MVTQYMHLSNLKLWNFRKYGRQAELDIAKPDLCLDFEADLNVLIGENDSGKSAIVDAIRLVLKTHSYEWTRIDEDDFHSGCNRLRIELVFRGMTEDEAKNFTEWLGWEGTGDAATSFLRLVLDVRRNPVNSQILPYEVRAGVEHDGRQLSPEAKEFLKATYLKPLRDAESELVARKNSRLSQILVAHEAFKDRGDDHLLMGLLTQFNASIEKYFEGQDSSGAIIADQLGKNLKESIDGYIAGLYGSDKKSELAVTERSQLKSLLEKLELSIRNETRPGLGTLNRLFMASELLHLNKSNWTGIRLGLVEELEAHLHPQAQMQAIETFQKQVGVQLILTTHSPNIGSKLELKNLIVCDGGNAFPMGAAYTELESDDYVFLEKFLDVTKANLFFCKGAILVEGWSEELLMVGLAKLIGYNLTERGVAVVNIGSLAFIRYANIFKRKAEPYFSKPVSVVTDADVLPDGEDKVAGTGDKKLLQEARAKKEKRYQGQSVKAFVSPKWTLEYCISKSTVLGEQFKAVVKGVHSKTDWTDFDATLAAKLKDKSLNKAEIAYRISKVLAETRVDANELENDEHVGYLVKAVKYACGV